MRALGGKSVGLVSLAAAVYAIDVRSRLVRWGATDEEVAQAFPGAGLIPDGHRRRVISAERGGDYCSQLPRGILLCRLACV